MHIFGLVFLGPHPELGGSFFFFKQLYFLFHFCKKRKFLLSWRSLGWLSGREQHPGITSWKKEMWPPTQPPPAPLLPHRDTGGLRPLHHRQPVKKGHNHFTTLPSEVRAETSTEFVPINVLSW